MVQVERKESGKEGGTSGCPERVGADQQHKAAAPLGLNTHTLIRLRKVQCAGSWREN